MKELQNDPPPEYRLATSELAQPSIGDLMMGDSERILNDLNIESYETANDVLKQEDLTKANKRGYIFRLVKEAKYRRNQLKGFKTAWTMRYKRGQITAEQKREHQESIDRSFKTLNRYIKFYEGRVEEFSGSGLKRKKGGSVRFFANTKDLLQRLEVIIGSILAGNTNREIRNTGVGILDLLLKEGAINKSQHEKIFKKYFNP